MGWGGVVNTLELYLVLLGNNIRKVLLSLWPVWPESTWLFYVDTKTESGKIYELICVQIRASCLIGLL